MTGRYRLPPWPRSVACHVFPSGLVHSCTCVLPSAAWKVPPAATAPAWFTATELPHDPGSWAGPPHEAASAGWTPQAPSPASDARAPVLIHLSERARD